MTYNQSHNSAPDGMVIHTDKNINWVVDDSVLTMDTNSRQICNNNELTPQKDKDLGADKEKQKDENTKDSHMLDLISELVVKVKDSQRTPQEEKTDFMMELLCLLHPQASDNALNSLLGVIKQYPEILVGAKPFIEDDNGGENDHSVLKTGETEDFNSNSDSSMPMPAESQDQMQSLKATSDSSVLKSNKTQKWDTVDDSMLDEAEDFEAKSDYLVQKANKPQDMDSAKWLCIKLPGDGIRFGNYMFIYATAYATAEKTGRRIITEEKMNTLKDVFKNVQFATAQRDSLNYDTLYLKHYATFHELPELPPDNDACLEGYFQSWKYFKEYDSNLRDQFQFKEDILDQAKNYMSKIRKHTARRYNTTADQVSLVGIHIRFSDMALPRAQEWGYSLPSLEYYHKAMLYYLAKYHNVHFVLATDSPNWAHENLGQFKNTFIDFTLQDRFEVDLAVLSLCDHIILSSGTFSWWAGWLSQGDVVYYNTPVRKNSNLEDGYEPRDYFMHKWIPMS